MSSWYSFFRPHKINRLIQDSIFDQFSELFEKTPEYRGAFILTEITEGGVRYYFSPDSVKIAKTVIESYEAEECKNPIENEELRKNYQFFVGDEVGYRNSYFNNMLTYN